MNRPSSTLIIRRQRGSGLLLAIGLVAVLGTTLLVQLTGYTHGRQMQRRAEVARAERLLRANAAVMLGALEAGADPSHPLFTEGDLPQKALLAPDGTLTLTGFHPAARVVVPVPSETPETVRLP